MTEVVRGRLLSPDSAPATGEQTVELARVHNLAVEQILSGALDEPVDYDQDQDEWVLLLDGAAELEVAGERVDLLPGDWVLLPARTPHRLVRNKQGTNWLAVHLHPSSPGAPAAGRIGS